MIILFCCNPLNNKDVDIEYIKEYDTVKSIGLNVGLINFEQLVVNGNPIAAIAQIPKMHNKELAIFRGWMMKPIQYENLYKTLLAKNIELINSPSSYKHCHYLPESYNLIKEYTPKSVWVNIRDLDKDFKNISQCLKSFNSNPIIVKDYVKSRKHEWFEACYIPQASDTKKATEIVRKFIELQGDEFNEGIVFREFVKLEFLSYHQKSNMPLSKEFRIFFMNREPLYVANYWDEGEYDGLKPDIERFLKLAKDIKSNFFTMDVAKIENGDWIIMELGDGQVAGLPENINLEHFYKSIQNF